MSELELLVQLGWDQRFQSLFNSLAARQAAPGRVIAQHRGVCVVATSAGHFVCEISGRLLHEARDKADLPTVGDWVACRLDAGGGGPSIIVAVLDRKTKFSRKAAGKVEMTSKGLKGTLEEQVIAANIDVLFVVTSLTGEFNPRRLERYLTMAWDGGVTPVIVLTKSDLSDKVHQISEEVRERFPLVDSVVTSAVTGDGIDRLNSYLAGHRTGALVGSSGVGKSSIINRLLGREAQAVYETRADDRGRHTTTARELLPLPNGGLMIDTPGIRELQLWGADEGVAETFGDIVEIASNCRFSNCSHLDEPDCAVKAALEDGSLDSDRYRSYRKLQRELAALERRSDYRAAMEHKKKWKAITKSHRGPRSR